MIVEEAPAASSILTSICVTVSQQLQSVKLSILLAGRVSSNCFANMTLIMVVSGYCCSGPTNVTKVNSAPPATMTMKHYEEDFQEYTTRTYSSVT